MHPMPECKRIFPGLALLPALQSSVNRPTVLSRLLEFLMDFPTRSWWLKTLVAQGGTGREGLQVNLRLAAIHRHRGLTRAEPEVRLRKAVAHGLIR